MRLTLSCPAILLVKAGRMLKEAAQQKVFPYLRFELRDKQGQQPQWRQRFLALRQTEPRCSFMHGMMRVVCRAAVRRIVMPM